MYLFFSRKVVFAVLLVLLMVSGKSVAESVVHMKTDAQIAQPSTLSGFSLVEQLSQGGYVIYFRHERATREPVERFAITPAIGCEQSNTLSRAGGDRAVANHHAILQLKLPIGKVFSSPYCRTAETARLVIGQSATQLVLSAALDSVHATTTRLPEQMRADAIALINQEMLIGKNLVLFGHREGIKALTGADINTGDAVILAPVLGAAHSVVGFVSNLRWMQMGADAVRKESMEVAPKAH